MSSFDPLRHGDVPAFTPLTPATSLGGAPPARNVFPAFDRVESLESPASIAGAESAKIEQASFTAGYAAGRAAAEDEGVAAAARFAAAVDELAKFRAGLLERYQRELLELALGVARKVVQRELAEHPEHWLGMLREAVRLALDREIIRIRVGPVLHRFLVDHFPELRAQLEDVKELELVEDASLGETGCVVESRYGDLDLGVDSQIGAIRATLMEAE